MKLEFFRQIFEIYSNLSFHEILSSRSQVVTCGQSARHDEADSRFSQFCERARQGQKFVLKFVGSTVDVLPVPHDIWVDVEWDRTVTFHPPTQAQPSIGERRTHYAHVATTILPRISKAAMRECAGEVSLLYTFSKHTGLRESGRVWSVYHIIPYHNISYHISYISYHYWLTYLLHVAESFLRS